MLSNVMKSSHYLAIGNDINRFVVIELENHCRNKIRHYTRGGGYLVRWFGDVFYFSGVNINFLFTISGVNQFSPLAPRFSGVMTQIFPAGLAALV